MAAATWALFLGILLLMLGNALQGALVGVRSEQEGFSLLATGLIMASYFAGFLVGSRYATHLLAEVGHIRVFAALASTGSAAVLAHTMLVSVWSWTVMRFVFGVCMAGIYVVAESWLNDMATNETRGRLLSVYMVVTMGAFAAGQFLLNLADTSSHVLFVLSSVLVSLSLVPISLSSSSAPPINLPQHMSVKELAAIVPTGLITSFLVGTAAGALMGMAPVYASRVGMSKGDLTAFLAAPMAGAVLAQWPIGWLSDRVSRRGVLLGVSLAASLVSLGPFLVDEADPALVGFMFLLGALIFPLYSLSVAYTNDWLARERIVGASGVLIRVNGTGAIIGPLVAAFLMSRIEPRMLFLTISVGHALIAVSVTWRILVIEALGVEQQRKYTPFPARGGVLAARLLPRRQRDGRDIEPHRRRDK